MYIEPHATSVSECCWNVDEFISPGCCSCLISPHPSSKPTDKFIFLITHIYTFVAPQINERALLNLFQALIANNRAGGWRKLKRSQ